MNLYVVLPIITFAFILSLFYYKKYKRTPYKYITYLLAASFLTECLAYFFGLYLRINNSVVYNVFTLFLFPFYFWFYRRIFKTKKYKKLMNFFIVVFLGTYFWELFILKNNFLTYGFDYATIIGSILVMITLILYLIEIINNEKIIFNTSKYFILWFTIGSLLFYIGIIPILIVTAYLNFREVYAYIISVLNIVMYSSFIIGYLVSDPKKII